MEINKLRTLIRESIQEYIKEIDEAAETAAMEARIAKCDEAIATRETKLNAIAESDHKDLMDEGKIKGLENEIKELKKAKAKFEKIAEKKAAKKAKKLAPKEEEVVTDAVTEEAPIDETDVMAEMDVTDEAVEETAINESFLRMQKLAGLITESQYNKKKSLIENENKKFTDVLGTGGYHLDITDKMKQDIKTQLGIGDEDIKFGYEEEQGDRFYWFATIGINLEALPEDKKSSYKDIISKIVRPAKTDDKTSTPTNSPKTAKSGLLNKIKSAFSENQLNEDILELKQMSKQLYSFLKSKGYMPKLVNVIDYKKEKTVGEDSPQVALIQVNEDQGIVNVAVSPWSAAHSIIGNKPDWYNEAVKKFGNSERWDSNSEILNHIDKLGKELSQQIKSKYPNMLYRFRRDGENWWYIMDFGYGQTKKGGQFNPNDPKNKLAN